MAVVEEGGEAEGRRTKRREHKRKKSGFTLPRLAMGETPLLTCNRSHRKIRTMVSQILDTDARERCPWTSFTHLSPVKLTLT